MGVADQRGNTSRAARTAASTSRAEESGTREITLPLLGSNTSSNGTSGDTKAPPMQFCTSAYFMTQYVVTLNVWLERRHVPARHILLNGRFGRRVSWRAPGGL